MRMAEGCVPECAMCGIMCSPGIFISSSGTNDRKLAFEIAIEGWFTSGDDVLRGS